MNDLIRLCGSVRDDISILEDTVRDIRQHPDLDSDEAPDANKAEIRGNAMLAYRHLEDARMRLGKVIQHAEGRGSIYDQNTEQSESAQAAGAGN